MVKFVDSISTHPMLMDERSRQGILEALTVMNEIIGVRKYLPSVPI
jgi:hypothetical protein